MTEDEAGYPKAWRPDAGDEISGTVTSVVLGPDLGGYGAYPIVNLDVDGTEMSVHAFHQVLRNELIKRRPKTGDPLTIKYLGKRTPKSGGNQPFHNYRVIGGSDQAFDWDQEAARAGIEVQKAPEPDVPVPQFETTPARQEPEDDLPFLWRQGSWDKATSFNPFGR